MLTCKECNKQKPDVKVRDIQGELRVVKYRICEHCLSKIPHWQVGATEEQKTQHLLHLDKVRTRFMRRFFGMNLK